MTFWSRIVNAGKSVLEALGFEVQRELPKKPKRKRGKRSKWIPLEKPQRELPKVSRETREPSKAREEEPPAFVEKLTALRTERQQKQELERIMFDDGLPDNTRKEALSAWADITGWWRPDNASEWSGEEWKRWEEIYEAEPESF